MNAQFRANLLQNLLKNKKNKGFTLIELLVVVIIVGVLAAVALPNLLGQVGKARETEGKNGIGAINRAQQAYHFEKQDMSGANPETANNALGVLLDSDYYTFATSRTDANNATSSATASNGVNDGVRNYQGGISFNAGQYDTAICQSDDINGTATATATGGAAGCSAGSELN